MKNEPKTYRVLQPIILSTTRLSYNPGAIVDLSHLPDESRRWFLDNKLVEAADGEPENDPAEPVKPCKNC